MSQSLSLDLTEGEIVKVSSADNFQGFKLAFYQKRCKDDDGYIVYLIGKDVPYSKVCIVPDRGDTIQSVSKKL